MSDVAHGPLVFYFDDDTSIFEKSQFFPNFRGSRCQDFSSKTLSYEAEMVCAGRQGVIVFMVSFSILSLQRRRNSPGPENRGKKMPENF